MAAKATKKTASNMRTSSAMNREAASIAASVGAQDAKRRMITIWPEWSDADINAEKWDTPHKGGKRDEKTKSPVVQHLFEDPEGKLELPPNIKVDHWKRPRDYITEREPVIVEDESNFDLMSANENVHDSELMRWITSQIQALWKQSEVRPGTAVTTMMADPSMADGESGHSWRPWEHIYAINKVQKGPNIPMYNAHGKYVIKLYWLGSWRKVIIDDLLPFDEQDRVLLPCTLIQHEIWPMLMAKALIKVASLDYNGASSACEFGDFSVIQCLTGWLPETIPLQYGHVNEIWELLKTSVTEFKLPEPSPEPTAEGAEKDPSTLEGVKDEKSEKEKEKSNVEKPDGKPVKEGAKEKGKEKTGDKKDKKDKDKEKGNRTRSSAGQNKANKADPEEKTMIQEEPQLPEHPEVVVFAAYSGPPKYPVRISVLREMADASERLRQTGLSHMYPHPVLITQTRSCPLEPPPPPEIVPSWKQIRPRRKRSTPTDEPAGEKEADKPIMCVEITSPFVNYKVSSVPIPTDTHRPKSSLERGSARVSSRPGTANVSAIEETDENAPEQEPTPASPPQPQKVEEPEPPKEELAEDLLKATSPSRDRKRNARSATKQGKSDSDVSPSPKPSKSGQPKSSAKRVGSALKGERDSKMATPTDPKVKDTGKVEAGKDAKASPAAADSPTDPSGVPSADCGDRSEATPEGTAAPDETNADEEKPSKVWMEFDNFVKCFKTLYIFHKPETYPCNYKHPDLKVRTTKDKETQNTTEDKSPSYLFVDSLKPTEVVVSFSALSRWSEPPPPPPKEESKIGLKTTGRDKGGDRDSKVDGATVDSTSVIDGGTESRQVEPLQPGLLVAEPYSWKSLVSGQPVLRLRTTATRAAVLSLPEGRHLLRINMSAPLGHHLHLSSSTQFVFGDEEKVMEQLTKESCRFVDNAVQVMTALGKCISTFSDPVTLTQAWEEYYACHCPYRNEKHASKQRHFQVFNTALYQMLRKVLNESNLATPEMAFAWRAFNFDSTTKNILGLPYGSSSRPATGVTTSDRGSAQGKKGAKKREPADVKVDPWKNKEWSVDDNVASVKIQKSWRGYYVRKITDARTPGSEANAKTQELLQKAWQALEPNLEQSGLMLFRMMFKSDMALMTKYPFYKDEWNKIAFADYQGTYTDQAPNTWFVVFREIFFVSEEMLCVPKLYVPIPTCMLRVINNDTGEEIPRVFQKVAPYTYKKNKCGYTFVAEARTLDHAIPQGRWRIRLIGSLSPLPAPTKNEVNSSFHVRELRDYYVPNEKNNILRYSVKVQDDHLGSLQMTTSKSDVYIKLQVLDREQEVISAVGKGHVVLPAFVFLKDPLSEDDKRSSSRNSLRGRASKENIGKGGRRVGSGRTSRSSHSRHSICSTEDDDEKTHKYVVQAQVLRNSWPLSESQWVFVQGLKEIEKNDIKLSQKERPPSPPRGEKQSATSTKGAKDKGGKGKGKDKDKGSRPPSQQFDFTKPNWMLRIVSDGALADDLETRRDTERTDEIRAMKKAWEDAEPGRSAKAMQSRLQYLNSHMVKPDESEDSEEKPASEVDHQLSTEGAVSPVPLVGLDAVESDGALTQEPPPPPPPKEILPLIDLTPFLRNSGVEPRLRDEAEIQRQLEAKQEEIAKYRAYREEVKRARQREREERNRLKIEQLETCERMQAALDAARETINVPREAYRQKFLEVERRRLEEIAAQEAALRAEQDKPPTPKGRKSAKGKKTPPGKKKK